jgi:hypothetical protein
MAIAPTEGTVREFGQLRRRPGSAALRHDGGRVVTRE